MRSPATGCRPIPEILATSGTTHFVSSALRESRKRMANGGMLVAIIGGDGSGKTTVVNELRQKLSEEFDVIKVHMGKPSWSWTTIIIEGNSENRAITWLVSLCKGRQRAQLGYQFADHFQDIPG